MKARPGLQLFDHCAVTNGLYAAAVLGVLAIGMGETVRLEAYAFVGCLAMATYLLDRVKLPWMPPDESDRLAHPDRTRLMQSRTRLIRVLMVVMLVLAAIAAIRLSLWLATLIPASLIGVLLYARPRERGWRPKDVFILKNATVAGCLVALSGVVLLVDAAHAWDQSVMERAADNWMAWPGLFAGVFAWVFGDAAGCDLDDVAGDRPFNTRTIPVLHGAHRTAIVMLALVTLGSLALLTVSPTLSTLVGAVLMLGSTLWLCLKPRETYRVFIDMRLPIIAAGMWLVAWL